MNWTHIAVLVIALLIGVVFAGTLRGLPLISSLPSY
jgi:hypothetical protein